MPLEAVDPVPVVEDRCLAALRLLASLHPRRCLCFRREIELGMIGIQSIYDLGTP